MNTEKAFFTINRHSPCPHENTDTSIGNGKIWAECNDCGETVLQANAQRYKDAANDFENAVQYVREAIAERQSG